MIINRDMLLVVVLAGCGALWGCETTEQQVREQRRQQWQDDISDQLAELSRSVDLLRQQQAALDRRTFALETSVRSVADAQRSLASFRGELQALREATDGKIRALIEEVARENERLLGKIRSSPKASYAQGYEHVVQAGETLSDIARQYKSSVKAILEANQISDPNTLRVGQKLFIPQ